MFEQRLSKSYVRIQGRETQVIKYVRKEPVVLGTVLEKGVGAHKYWVIKEHGKSSREFTAYLDAIKYLERPGTRLANPLTAGTFNQSKTLGAPVMNLINDERQAAEEARAQRQAARQESAARIDPAVTAQLAAQAERDQLLAQIAEMQAALTALTAAAK